MKLDSQEEQRVERPEASRNACLRRHGFDTDALGYEGYAVDFSRTFFCGDGKPIANAYPIFKDLTAELKVQTDRLQEVIGSDLAAFNDIAKRLGLETVAVSRPGDSR